MSSDVNKNKGLAETASYEQAGCFSSSADPPDRPSAVALSVASEEALLVRFNQPMDDSVLVTKYKGALACLGVVIIKQ